MRMIACNPATVLFASFAICALSVHADQLQMQNGDRYTGKILSVTSDSVVLQSDMLGKITLPRSKVSVLTIGEGPTNSAPAPAAVSAAAPSSPNLSATNIDLSSAFHSLGADTNFIQAIRNQLLAGAGPQVNAKYDEMVGGLMSGKLNLNDLRNEARASINQINQIKHELGPEADDALDGYLSILQSFVNETAAGSFTTNNTSSFVVHTPKP